MMTPYRDEDSAARILARCDQLAQCSEETGRLTRTYLSPALRQAHELVGGWMREAGLSTRVDAVGSLIGKDEIGRLKDESGADSRPVLIIGSHLDTVRDAGKYDGMLGVLLGIEVAADCGAEWRSRGEDAPFSIEVIGFGDEEGVRFSTPYLGSRALAGTFDSTLLELRDADGITLSQALRDFGLDPDAWETTRYHPQKVVGYLEAHIEQGPVLETEHKALGVVSAIAGQTRLRLCFEGRAGHAGTQPMTLRRDALAAAAAWISAVEAVGRDTENLVATVGSLTVEPNVSNVVPGTVVCSLDVRHPHDEVRLAAVEQLLSIAQDKARQRGIETTLLARTEHGAVPMDTDLRDRLARCAANASGTESVPIMVSGAGHDAAIMAHLAPCAMLFLRSPGGVSHHPDEAVLMPDVALALHTLRSYVESLAAEMSKS